MVLVPEADMDALVGQLLQPPARSESSGPPARPESPGQPPAPAPVKSAPSAAPPAKPSQPSLPPMAPPGPALSPVPGLGGAAPAMRAPSPLPPISAPPASVSVPPVPLARPTGPAPGPAAREPAAGGASAEDEPIIKLVDSVLTEAVHLRASDIHVEPLADRLRVRYRIDGVLHDVNTPPKALQGPLTSRLKILAALNIAEKRLPQDGRIQLTVQQRTLDVRVSVLPALHGESIVMRLLDRTHAVHGVGELGLAEADQRRWEQLIRRPYGMILVTGPTGSGKTTTLYATLAALNQPERKLITVEDPVEYQLSGINQVSVKSSIGLTFSAGLRAMLRQAPDIIMVGEIRDAETAQVAIQAALTGHLVFSTLHTNDAPAAMTRLMDMGIAPFLVASTVQGVMAQRLVRRICEHCAARRPPTPEEQLVLGEPPLAEVVEGHGCEPCHQSGYRGRVGIYELLTVTDELRHLVASKNQASRLRRQAQQDGMRSLRDDGAVKVRAGLTTVAEVLRATPEEAAA
ncbi:MAG: Flp pilus assembly complex ATPase component TadA [Candidatus Omnitrophica bacterium]|nr:Flp pilus assembly complex ATPase component TadA [Candidatus Omnitrophota bacterium]